MKLYLLILTILPFFLVSCDSVTNNESSNDNSAWLIPETEVFDGGPGKDGIPALQNPEMGNINSINYLDDNDLVIIFKEGNAVKIYPHKILDWHEIVNDNIGSKAYAITYCPLTGSAICWDRTINGTETTFGVSGLLYNSNLLPYDRLTESYWSQMLNKSVKGNLVGQFATTYQLIESSWSTAKTTYPNALVLTKNTGHSRNYDRYPYGSYKTSNSFFIFPVSHLDDRLPSKERVLGIQTNNFQKAYRINDFKNLQYIIEEIEDEIFLVVIGSEPQIAIAFKLKKNIEGYNYKILNNELPFILEDDNGIKYDLFGKASTNNLDDLEPVNYYIAYWFAWASFFHDTELYTK